MSKRIIVAYIEQDNKSNRAAGSVTRSGRSDTLKTRAGHFR